MTSLNGCPEEINEDFNCSYNQLTTLEYCPQKIEGYFVGGDNQLADLTFFPKLIGGEVFLSGNLALGQSQEIHDFEQLFSIHRALLKIKTEQTILEQAIALPQNSLNSKKNNKI